MEASMKAKSPEEIVFELTMSMPLRDWERVLETLDLAPTTNGPTNKFILYIREMVRDAKQHFYPEDEKF